jgi:hypothetical protein
MISPFLVFQMDYSGCCRAFQQNLQVGYFGLVSEPKRRWYAAMHAAEQNRMCQ